MAHVTIQDALLKVANYPRMVDDDLIEMPVYELVARALFDIANNPDPKVRGATTRANRARKILLDRMVGKRRAGSHPATRSEVAVEFKDLTGGELE